MFDFDNKPEDYDKVMHGEETRFVIFEKHEKYSRQFRLKMLCYCRISLKKTLSIFDSIIAYKTKT